jgi:hypothetical protein
MDPTTGAAIASTVGSTVGNFLGRKDRHAAARRREQAIQALERLRAEMGQSAAENEDPAMRQEGVNALSSLHGVYSKGGMDPGSVAALRESMDATGAAERGTRGAITQNFAARGAGGAGAELAAQIANQQGGAQRNAQAGTRAAADARTRALEAMKAAGGLASNVRGQDLQRAGALDEVARFNAAQRTRQAGMLADAYTGSAVQSDRQADQSRFDFGQLGQVAGAGLAGYFGQKKKPEEGA